MCIYICACVCVILLYYNIIYIIHHSLRGGDHFCPLHAVTCQYRNGSSMIFIASFPRSPAPEPLLKGRPSSCTAGSSSPARQVQELRHFGRSQCRLRPTNMDGWWSYNWNPHKGIDNQWPPNIWYSFSLSNYWRWLKWPWKNWENWQSMDFWARKKIKQSHLTMESHRNEDMSRCHFPNELLLVQFLGMTGFHSSEV